MNTPVRHDLAEVEQIVCRITSEQLGIPRHKISLMDRMIEDLHCDSLELVELLMELEDEFQVEISNDPPNSAYKSVFTRHPFRLMHLAELVYLQLDSPVPVKKRWGKQFVTPVANQQVPFTQLGGRWHGSAVSEPLFDLLEEAESVAVYRRRSDGMRCMLLPGSTVQIGSQCPGVHRDNYPQHTCELDNFLMDAEPVSTTAYCRFLNSINENNQGDLKAWFVLDDSDSRSTHSLIHKSCSDWRPVAGTEKWPMILVSWFGANAYSLWANGQDWRRYEATELDSCFLPSEAQWEYAARGAKYREFPWGDEEPSNVSINYGKHVRGQVYNVQQLPLVPVNELAGMSPFGLHHMAGNVWQWCRDWYDEDFYGTAAASDRNPLNTQPSNIRSERGGSWIGSADLCRSSYRRGRTPTARGRCLGFRCISLPSNAN